MNRTKDLRPLEALAEIMRAFPRDNSGWTVAISHKSLAKIASPDRLEVLIESGLARSSDEGFSFRCPTLKEKQRATKAFSDTIKHYLQGNHETYPDIDGMQRDLKALRLMAARQRGQS